MTFLFLLQKKSLGGNSSTKIGVRYSLNIVPSSGFPLVDCKGVMDRMGLSIYLDVCFMAASVNGSFDVGNGVSPTPFEGISI
jgi:hypothetical protein